MNNDDYAPLEEPVGKELRDAYRELAVERAPLHLDKAVLKEAAQASKPAGGSLWSWRRPVAWATMITLSFVIVLESTRETPDADLPSPDALSETAAPAESPSEIRSTEGRRLDGQAVGGTVLKTEAEKRARDRELDTVSAPAMSNFTDTSPRAAQPASGSLQEPQPAADSVAAEEDRQFPEESVAVQESSAASVESEQAGTQRLGDRYYLAPASEEPSCDGDTRADPVLWRTCIEELFAAERPAEALVELGLYRSTFPDQPLPDLAK